MEQHMTVAMDDAEGGGGIIGKDGVSAALYYL